MKVWIFYLSYSEDPDLGITRDMIEWFNLFPKPALDAYIDKINFNLEKAFGMENYYLYAVTDSSQYAFNFEEMHDMRFFKKRVKHISKEEYKEFEEKCEGFILEPYKYRIEKKNKNGAIILTKLEKSCVEEFESHIIDEIYTHTLEPYEYYKDSYIRALDILLYTSFNKMSGPEAEFYDYQFSYGCTPEGCVHEQVRINTKTDEFYIKLFSLILRKDW